MRNATTSMIYYSFGECKMGVFPGKCVMRMIRTTFHWMMNDHNFGDTLHDDVLLIRGVYVVARDVMAMTYLDKL